MAFHLDKDLNNKIDKVDFGYLDHSHDQILPFDSKDKKNTKNTLNLSDEEGVSRQATYQNAISEERVAVDVAASKYEALKNNPKAKKADLNKAKQEHKTALRKLKNVRLENSVAMLPESEQIKLLVVLNAQKRVRELDADLVKIKKAIKTAKKSGKDAKVEELTKIYTQYEKALKKAKVKAADPFGIIASAEKAKRKLLAKLEKDWDRIQEKHGGKKRNDRKRAIAEKAILNRRAEIEEKCRKVKATYQKNKTGYVFAEKVVKYVEDALAKCEKEKENVNLVINVCSQENEANSSKTPKGVMDWFRNTKSMRYLLALVAGTVGANVTMGAGHGIQFEGAKNVASDVGSKIGKGALITMNALLGGMAKKSYAEEDAFEKAMLEAYELEDERESGTARFGFEVPSFDLDLDGQISEDVTSLNLEKEIGARDWILEFIAGALYKMKEVGGDKLAMEAAVSFTKLFGYMQSQDAYRGGIKGTFYADSDNVKRLNLTGDVFLPNSLGELKVTYQLLQKMIEGDFDLSGELEDKFTQHSEVVQYVKHLSGLVEKVGAKVGHHQVKGSTYETSQYTDITDEYIETGRIIAGFGGFEKWTAALEATFGKDFDKNSFFQAVTVDVSLGGEKLTLDKVLNLAEKSETSMATGVKGTLYTEGGAFSLGGSVSGNSKQIEAGYELEGLKIYYQNNDLGSQSESRFGFNITKTFDSFKDLFKFGKKKRTKSLGSKGLDNAKQLDHAYVKDVFESTMRQAEIKKKDVKILLDLLDKGVSPDINNQTLTFDAAPALVGLESTEVYLASGEKVNVNIDSALTFENGNLKMSLVAMGDLLKEAFAKSDIVTVWAKAKQADGKYTLVKVVLEEGSVIVISADFMSNFWSLDDMLDVISGKKSINDLPSIQNTAPEATDDSFSTFYGTAISLHVLGNDTDSDGDTLSISDITDEVGGTFEVENGLIIFTPELGFYGEASCKYIVSDGNGGTDTAEAKITVGEKENTAPDATDDSFSTSYGTAISLHVLGNDTDSDGDALSIFEITDEVGGTFEVENGLIIFTPELGFSGEASCKYIVSDGNGGTDTGEVEVTVREKENTAPDATDDSFSTSYGTAISLHVLGNDTDSDGDALSIFEITDEVGGTFEVENGLIIFTPAVRFSGKASCKYIVSDGNGGTDTAEVEVTVGKKRNIVPRMDKNIDSQTIDLGDAIEDIDCSDAVTLTDGDPIIEYRITSGSLPAGLTLDTETGIISGTPTETGTFDFGVDAKDKDGWSSDGKVTIVVNALPNVAPNAVNDSTSTAFNTAKTFNVLGNDSDSDGGTLTVTGISNQVGGTFVNNGNGTITFTPTNGFVGGASCTYQISDGQGGSDTATFSVTVNAAPNVAPNAVNDSTSTAFNTPTTVNVLTNDSDADGGTLTITGISSQVGGAFVNNGNGTITFTPTNGFVGAASCTYQISDGQGGNDTATFSITVDAPPNNAPTLNLPVSSTTVTVGDANPSLSAILADVDGDNCTYTVAIVSGGGSVAGDTGGSSTGKTINFSYNIPGAATTAVIRVTVDDGNGGVVTRDITVTVNDAPPPPNVAPSAVNDSTSTAYNTPTTVNVLTNDSDSDGGTLTVTGISNQVGGTFVDNGNGTITFTPTNGFVGAASCTYQISDGQGGNDTATFSITVDAPPNNAPTLNLPVSSTTVTVGDANPSLSAILADVDGDNCTYTVAIVSGGGSVAGDTGGSSTGKTINFSYNIPGAATTAVIRVTVDDGNGGVVTRDITVTVNDAPPPPC